MTKTTMTLALTTTPTFGQLLSQHHYVVTEQAATSVDDDDAVPRRDATFGNHPLLSANAVASFVQFV